MNMNIMKYDLVFNWKRLSSTESERIPYLYVYVLRQRYLAYHRLAIRYNRSRSQREKQKTRTRTRSNTFSFCNAQKSSSVVAEHELLGGELRAKFLTEVLTCTMLVSTEELAVLTARIGPVAALQPLKLRDLARETTSKTPKLSLQTLSPPDSANTRLSSAACATVVSTEEQLCDSTATANVRQHCDSKCATALRQQLCDSNCATALRQQVCDSTVTAIVRQQLCDSTATAIVRRHCDSNCDSISTAQHQCSGSILGG